MDLEDSDLVISYELLGKSIPCPTMVNAALNGLTQSAQVESDDSCTGS